MAAPPAGTGATTATCAVPDAEPGAGLRWRCFRSLEVEQGACRRPRLRLAGRGVLRADAAGCIPLGGADERAVRRRADRRPRRARSTRIWRSSGRKHYQWYYSTREADDDMRRCPQGVHAFLRAYYHYKSADWPGNRPFRSRAGSPPSWRRCRPTTSWSSTRAWRETVGAAHAAGAPAWLTDESCVYAEHSSATASRAGCSGIAARTNPRYAAELSAASPAGRIDIPSMYIAGGERLGRPSEAGRVRAHAGEVCTDLRGCHLVAGAGHWVQQEQPEKTAALLLDFLRY